MSRVLFPFVVAVLLAGVSTPRSVEASCGDWLQHSGSTSIVAAQPSSMRISEGGNSESGTQQNRHLEMAQQGLPSQRLPSRGLPSQSVPAKPCDGPLCGQLPVLPIPAPMIPVAERPHHDAVWKAGAESVRLGEFLCRSQEDSMDVQPGFSLGIDRPPQMTLSQA
ncbi:putative transmembrane protein [Rhodopirellula islandica]|uniref:Transmembrane protein n=1 Tax=Rhodopirellula islandica TaxID=595434 RepID=A0A0J1BLM9_RHOIS|nr:hypothetical protein [Rhodopirellula islandica]KLU07416.1 putative transmembrane protein [Rhodopirellula islandica]